MYLATQCTDVQWPTSWAKWQKDNWATFQKAPFETWSNAWYNAPCLTWPAKAGKPVTIDGSKVKSVLLIDETLDAATPYEGSLVGPEPVPATPSCSRSPAAPPTPAPCSGTRAWTTRSRPTSSTGALPARKPGDRADAYCAPLPQPVPTASAVSAQATVGQGDRDRGQAERGRAGEDPDGGHRRGADLAAMPRG